MNLPKTILVPTDFSEPATIALDYAVNLAEKLDARVVVLHAYEIPVFGFPDAPLIATTDVAARIITAAQGALESTAARYKTRKVTIESLLKTGDAREMVHHVADEIGADLIVMGTHGRKGVARALLGSVTENVIRSATRPVLTIHPSAPAHK
jgi:nucleotide-binding universal stress UspA family protein